MKKMFSIVILLLCISASVFAFAEKQERIIWMAAEVPWGDQYLVYYDFEDSARIGPRFVNERAWLVYAIDCEPGAYYVLEKEMSLEEISNDQSTVVTIMHFDGEANTPYVENLTLEDPFQYIAYLNGFLYYTKWQTTICEEKEPTEELCLVRVKKDRHPEVVAKLPEEDVWYWYWYPMISERGDLVYAYNDEKSDCDMIVYISSFGEGSIEGGYNALWMDADNILYTFGGILYCYNLEKKESQVFLDEAGQSIPMPFAYSLITINKNKDTLAYFVDRPDEEMPKEYRDAFQGKPYTLSLITGEHRLIEEADFIGDNSLMTWWGEQVI